MSKNRIISCAVWIMIWVSFLAVGTACMYFGMNTDNAYTLFMLLFGTQLTFWTLIFSPLILSAPNRIYEAVVHDLDIKYYKETIEVENADFNTVFHNTTKNIFKGATSIVCAACALMPLPAALYMFIVDSFSKIHYFNGATIGLIFFVLLIWDCMVFIRALPILMYDSEYKTVDERQDDVEIIRPNTEIPVPDNLKQTMRAKGMLHRTSQTAEINFWTREYMNYLKEQHPEIADDEELLTCELKNTRDAIYDFVRPAGASTDYRSSSLYRELYPRVAKKMNDKGSITTRQDNNFI